MIRTQHGRVAILLGTFAAAIVMLLMRGLLAAPPADNASPPQSVIATVLHPFISATQPAGTQTATFAAGCFWSMQAIFQQLKGVEAVAPGYAGGSLANSTYDQVETGDTGHAETLTIYFNAKKISYSDLLDVLLTVRNPTTVDAQGPDEGSQYRSVIFYHDDAQRVAAQQAIARIDAAHIWPNKIVTAVSPFTHFYPAETYHDDYYNQHPDEPYCRTVIAPEIASFRQKFASKLKP